MKYLYAIHHYDTLVFLRLVNFCERMSLRLFWRILSKTGDGPLYLAIAATMAGFDKWTHYFIEAAVLAFLIERPIYLIVKNSLQRNRPQDALVNFKSHIVPHDKFSFPSGHTSAAFLMATLGGTIWPILFIPLYIWAFLVGVSRVMLGVHFPTDILAGALLGISTAHLGLLLIL